MSRYTTSLMEMFYRVSSDRSPLDMRIRQTADYLFNFDYDWYADTSTSAGKQSKDMFERLFVEEYFLNEIAFETLELFRLKLKHTLNREMPIYRQLYKTTIMEFDPLLSYGGTSQKTESFEESSMNDVTKKNETKEVGGITETHEISGKGKDQHDDTNKLTKSAEKTRTENGSNRVEETGKETNTTSGSSEVSITDKRTDATKTVASGSKNTEGSYGKINNGQAINSDNPQTSISTNDYASEMSRSLNEEKGDNSQAENTQETSTVDLESDDKHDESATSNSDGTTNKTNKTESSTKNTAEISETGTDNTIATGTTTHEKNETDTVNRDTNDNVNLSGSEKAQARHDYDRSDKSSQEGYNIPRADLIIKYRDTFLNLNKMLLGECRKLFMLVYDAGYGQNIYGGGDSYGFWG